jgi:outer membrane protein
MRHALGLFICALLMFLGSSAEVRAEQTIAVVDVRKLVEESAAGKSIQTVLKARRDILQKEANAFEKKMREEEQALIKSSKEGKAEDFNAKKKAFEENFVKTRQSILKRTTDLDNQRKVALRKLQEHIGEVTADLADERKIKIVIDRELVVIVNQSLDMTDAALKALDARVTNIPLE